MAYNLIENTFLFISLLNSVLYPSASTAIYYIFTIGLTLTSMTREEQKIKLKFIFAILFTLIAFGIMITKGVFLILLNNEGDIRLSSDERMLYDSLGIRIDQTMIRIKFYNTFMTLFFDIIQLFSSAILSGIYYSQRRDCIKVYTNDESTSFLMHPIFEK
jgi:hypothetical protein